MAEEGAEAGERGAPLGRLVAEAVAPGAQRATSTGTTPFTASRKSVAIAALRLPERSTLVAPGLPEP